MSRCTLPPFFYRARWVNLILDSFWLIVSITFCIIFSIVSFSKTCLNVLFDFFCIVNGKCKISQFQCGGDTCISKELVCDGKAHCSDKLDEANCGLSNETIECTLFSGLNSCYLLFSFCSFKGVHRPNLHSVSR